MLRAALVRVGTTLKPAAQQFPALVAAASYAPVSLDPFDRLVDTNTPARANQVIGGISAIADWNLGPVTLTSVSAWRTWNWDPAKRSRFHEIVDPDPIENPDNQNQYSEEFRVSSNGKRTVDYVGGLYYFRQKIDADADCGVWRGPQLAGCFRRTSRCRQICSKVIARKAKPIRTSRAMRPSPRPRGTITRRSAFHARPALHL